MNTTTGTTTTTATYEVVTEFGSFFVLKNGEYLRDKTGAAYKYNSASGARKRITRDRSGNFHA